MKHAPQERPSANEFADGGEQNHLEMFGAIGFTRGLVPTTANMARVNQLEGRIRKNRIWLAKWNSNA
jgi:hypothetical protein